MAGKYTVSYSDSLALKKSLQNSLKTFSKMNLDSFVYVTFSLFKCTMLRGILTKEGRLTTPAVISNFVSFFHLWYHPQMLDV